MIRPLLLAAALALSACGDKPGQVSARALTGYDAAVAAELGYFEVKHATMKPAEGKCLQGLRLAADKAVKDIDSAGASGTANAQLMTAATNAAAALQAASTGKGGC